MQGGPERNSNNLKYVQMVKTNNTFSINTINMNTINNEVSINICPKIIRLLLSACVFC